MFVRAYSLSTKFVSAIKLAKLKASRKAGTYMRQAIASICATSEPPSSRKMMGHLSSSLTSKFVNSSAILQIETSLRVIQFLLDALPAQAFASVGQRRNVYGSTWARKCPKCAVFIAAAERLKATAAVE